ncbi:MAG: helix-turn-helix transcriptional regulator [Acidimicrobiia bacterium]|nr:helix-turn-helix transcriptional regulator [Acidimicrobiia bacterium]
MAGAEALERAVASVGDRWTLLLIDALLDGGKRFSELDEAVPGLAPNILSRRLRHLEHEGLVVSTPYSRRPLRVRYDLTASGTELAGALALLTGWGARRNGVPAPRHHGACGTAVEARWWCPTCDRVVADDDANELRYA